MVHKLLFLTVAFLCGVCNGSFTRRTTQKEGEEDTINISPKCAAVLVTAGTGGGGALAYALAPAALCKAGFCSVGVSSSSFASWWQSTMPLVQTGSIFATLQSITMGGASTKIVVAGSVLGGSLSLKYLQALCDYVDDPESKMAPIFSANLEAVKRAHETAEKVKTACLSSETCTSAIDTLYSASQTAYSSVTSVWSYVSNGLERVKLKEDIARLIEEIEGLDEQIAKLKEDLAEKSTRLQELS